MHLKYGTNFSLHLKNRLFYDVSPTYKLLQIKALGRPDKCIKASKLKQKLSDKFYTSSIQQ
jgi:hypothetical protein